MLYYKITAVFLSILGLFGLGSSIISLPNPPTLPYFLTGTLLVICLIGMFIGKDTFLFSLSLSINSSWALVQYTTRPIIEYLNHLPKTKLSIPPEQALNIILGLETLPLLLFILMISRAMKNFRDMKVAQGDDADPLMSFLSWFKGKSEEFKYKNLDTVICQDAETKKPVMLEGRFRFTTLGVFGTTGTGKTESVFLNMIRQDLERLKKGMKIAITVIEPTKDLADKVAVMCEKLDIPCVYIDPTNPKTRKFNILQGDKMVAAEATRSVLATLFGKQQAFFGQVQQTAARNTVLLLKELHGDDIDIMDVLRTLRDEAKLQGKVNLLKKKQGQTDLVQYFEYEILGEMKDKYHQFAAGLRQQLEDIGGNELLKRVFSGDSDINLDRHLSQGGVFIVNTAMGDLMKKLGEVFGEYVLMHLIFAIFRKEKRNWGVPHAMYIDELPKYINPDIGFDDLLSISRKYGNMTTMAMQSTSQLTIKMEKEQATNNLLTLCRSKIVFGGMDAHDAKRFEEEFGEDEVEMKQATYENKIFLPSIWAKSYRTTKMKEARYSYTKLMELEGYHFIYRIVKGAQLQPPRKGKGILVNIENLKSPVKSITLSELINRLKGGKRQEDIPVSNKIVFIKGGVNKSQHHLKEDIEPIDGSNPQVESKPKIKFITTQAESSPEPQEKTEDPPKEKNLEKKKQKKNFWDAVK